MLFSFTPCGVRMANEVLALKELILSHLKILLFQIDKPSYRKYYKLFQIH